MFRLFKQVVKDVVTEKDGVSFDITKVLWAIGTLIFFGLTIYTVIVNPASFNYVTWGGGFAAILAGGSAGVKVKESTEQNTSTGVTQQQISEKS
jgi:hypothetical protein